MKERRSSARLEADKILLNLENKTEEELRDILEELYEEERQISYRRRMLHGKIDIVRQELVNRLGKKHKKGKNLISDKDVDKLTEILSKTLADDGAKGK
ncbi:hypothetical protein LCGC14_0533780 [marine sediment metagenome]|uniref:RsiG-like domain-containing protein n=1 Tax=marine sediment metagenome TaxID=412755 RepID=A0A0F9RUX1_9ZZZZ